MSFTRNAFWFLVASAVGAITVVGCSPQPATDNTTETNSPQNTPQVSETTPATSTQASEKSAQASATTTPVSRPTATSAQPSPTIATPTLPNTPLTYSKDLNFSSSGVSGTIRQVDTPTEDLAQAAQEAKMTDGTWFKVEVTNQTAAEIRPQLINLHTSDNQHYQAYGEVATSFTFAKNAPDSQTIKNLSNKYSKQAPLSAGESKTIYFFSPAKIPDGFETGTIQFMQGTGNLVIDLDTNN